MEYLLCLLIFVPLVCSTCTDGYEDMGNGECYKYYSTNSTQRDAEAYCEEQGGHLVQPLNAFVNAYILTEATNVGVWLGLTCTGSTKTSCTYSNGDYVTSSSYANFYPGYPDPTEGNCVFLSTSGSQTGKWISGKCGHNDVAFGCQRNGSGNTLPPNYVPKCGSAYGSNGNFCYKMLAPSIETSAEEACELECGHLTTIHSQDENSFVRDLASQTGGTYARIGLKWTSDMHYEWTDGTRMAETEYVYFGYDEPALGNCVAISLVDDLVKSGQWINTPCSSNMTSVCKRSKSKPCVSRTVAPSVIPPTCSSPSFLEGNGTIYSPGFPSNYANGLECEYVITAPPGFVVFFALNGDERFPDPASSISLYNGIMDTAPFLSRLFHGSTYAYTFYASTSSSMKVKFSSGSSDKYKWTANYTSIDIRPSGCNQGVLQTPGTITSPNYGSNLYGGFYPSQYNCSYQLQAPSNKRISLIFNNFLTESSDDVVSVYDGPDSKSTLLGKFDGPNAPSPITSSNNRMFLLFTSDINQSYPGFHVTFTAV